jgi:hypothetical protein
VIVVACSGDDASDQVGDGGLDTTVAASSAPTSGASMPTGPPTPADGSLFPSGDIDDGLQPWVELATADLAARLAIAPEVIEPVSAVLVVWPDVSLGCPEPDRQYATVVTDGAVIELAVDGAIYRYHAGGSQSPFLCAAPITTAPNRL